MKCFEHRVERFPVEAPESGAGLLSVLEPLGVLGWEPWHLVGPAGTSYGFVWLKREIDQPAGGDITEDQYQNNMAEHAAKLSGQSYSVRK